MIAVDPSRSLALLAVATLVLGMTQLHCDGRTAGQEPAAAMNEAIGLLDRYDYPRAYERFSELVDEFPQWVGAHVNRGIAALNVQGDEYFRVAERSFKSALKLDPDCCYALFGLGILYEYTERFDDAYEAFQRVAERDPHEPFTRYYLGNLLANRGELDAARRELERAIELQPSLASAHYRLRPIYYRLKKKTEMKRAVGEFDRLEKARAGLIVDVKYGDSGKYSLAMRDLPPLRGPERGSPPKAGSLRWGARRVVSSRGAVERRRPDGKALAPGVSFADFDADGTLEIVLCSVPIDGGGTGVTIVASPTPDTFVRQSTMKTDALLCATGDFDGDAKTDLVLAGEGWLRVYHVDAQGLLSPASMKVDGDHTGFPVRLFAVDADSDWDLDIVCLRQQSQGGRVVSKLQVMNNNRDGSFRDIAPSAEVDVFDFPAGELIVTDLDGDIDVDFAVIDSQTGRVVVCVNDRVWRWRRLDGKDLGWIGAGAPVSARAADIDADGAPDFLICDESGVSLVRNEGALRFRVDSDFRKRLGPVAAAVGVTADFTAEMQPSLLLLPAVPGGDSGHGDAALRFVARLGLPGASSAAVDLAAPSPYGDSRAGLSVATVLLSPRGGPSLFVYDTTHGAQLWDIDSVRRWIGFELVGPTKPLRDKERSNVGGIGATTQVRAGESEAVVQVDTGAAGTVREPPRIWVGLDGVDHVDSLRVFWPDGVLQAELALVGNRLHRIVEIDRKPSSCPILFAWDGEQFAFVGDFLGVGGIGYFEAPGEYNRPDPTEFLVLPDLKPQKDESHGRASYHLEVLEPLEECTYLDEFTLVAVDHPADLRLLPDERFALNGPQPGFQLLEFSRQHFPESAVDTDGRDVTDALQRVDRTYANEVEHDRRFSGRAVRDHHVVMDFGTAIDRVLADAASQRDEQFPVLFLYGYIEYGYSTSNFAASQARAEFRPPTFEVERGGRWVELRRDWGFPAGTPRFMSVDLAGLLEPGDRRLRVRTNMEIYWDQAFLTAAARLRDDGSTRTMELQPDVATLDFAGFIPERSPDGLMPKLFLYEDLRPSAPFRIMPGNYTRFGDVRELLVETDDRFALFGPGERLKLRFQADRLPPLRSSMKRSFFAKVTGYCKDMDLYTAHPDRVEPLPFASMSSYPYGSESLPSRLDEYGRRWNSRRVDAARFEGYDEGDAVWKAAAARRSGSAEQGRSAQGTHSRSSGVGSSPGSGKGSGTVFASP